MSIIYDIALTLVTGIGAVKASQITELYGTAKKALDTSKEEGEAKELNQAILSRILFQKNAVIERAINIVEHCEKNNVAILTLDDPRYPELLRQIPDAPTVLYVRGNLNFNNSEPVAIVGTRAMTAIGASTCTQLVQELSNIQNVYTVSGLALGVDKHAHLESIKNNIPTVAVMAGWVDDIVPRSHYHVARQIIESGGAIVSEMPPGSSIVGASFLVRNRIIAGMSKAIVMVQSSSRGGSMATANLAFNYDREVFVPLGDNSEAFEGNIILAKQNKANIMQSFSDMLDVMNWRTEKERSPRIDHMPDYLIEALGLLPEHDFSLELASDCWNNSITDTCRLLSMLEINGLVTALKGGLYAKI